jgi:hypothetical protein
MAKEELQGSPKAEIDNQEETEYLPPSTPKANDNNTHASSPQPIGHKLCPEPERDITENKSVYSNQSKQNPPAMARFLAECDSPWTVFGQTGYPTAETPPDFGTKTTTGVATHGSASDQGHENSLVSGGGNEKVGSEVKSACDGTQRGKDEAGVRQS